jgi:hypothetical protein
LQFYNTRTRSAFLLAVLDKLFFSSFENHQRVWLVSLSMINRAASSAPGKAILFGEHAVVHGAAAIAATLSDWRIVVSIIVRNSTCRIIYFKKLKPTAMRSLAVLGFLAGSTSKNLQILTTQKRNAYKILQSRPAKKKPNFCRPPHTGKKTTVLLYS